MIFDNQFFFKSNTYCILCVYSFVYLFEIFMGITFNNNWELKCIGTIFGYFLNDIIIKTRSLETNIYIKNLIKSFSILFSQSIILKLLISNFNIIIICLYLLVYTFVDIISDLTIKNNNKNRELYVDIIKTGLGFIIVESCIKERIETKDYLYVFILCIGLLIYYKKIDKYINVEK